MTNNEFHSFLEYVYNEHLRKRIHRIGRDFGHREVFHRWEYEWQGLKRALHVIDYIQTYCDDEDDIYRTFRIDRLGRAVDEIKNGVHWHNWLAREIGLLDALDQYYQELSSGLDIADFPEHEYQMLQEFGFHNPKVDLQGVIYLIKIRQKQRMAWQKEKLYVSRELEHTVEILASAQKDFHEDDEEEEDENTEGKSERPKKSRRWFKGLGKIGQGAAMSIGDICLAAGLLSFPVSPETQTWGSLVSATAGVTMVLDGVGELRGE